MDLNGFNASDVEPSAPREVIPAGWYKAVITESVETPTKAQTGSFLKLTVQIIDGEHAGKSVTDRLNLNNPNATAVDIARRTLSAICHATGVMTPRDSHDLHDKPLMVMVKVKPKSGDYEASNEVGGYEKASGSQSRAADAPAAASGAATPPWKRKAV